MNDVVHRCVEVVKSMEFMFIPLIPRLLSANTQRMETVVRADNRPLTEILNSLPADRNVTLEIDTPVLVDSSTIIPGNIILKAKGGLFKPKTKNMTVSANSVIQINDSLPIARNSVVMEYSTQNGQSIVVYDYNGQLVAFDSALGTKIGVIGDIDYIGKVINITDQNYTPSNTVNITYAPEYVIDIQCDIQYNNSPLFDARLNVIFNNGFTSVPADLFTIERNIVLDNITIDNAYGDDIVVQRAIDSILHTGGVVTLTARTYICLAPIVVRRGITVRGSSKAWQRKYPYTSRIKGTVLAVDFDYDNAVKLESDTCIEGIVFYYPNQTFSAPPKPYPALIKILQGSTRVKIESISAINPYVFIDASAHHELLTIRDVNGFPLSIGIVVDYSTDIDRIENVHFNPNIFPELIDMQAPLLAWVARNGKAFVIGRLDWARIDNCFCWGYDYGFLIQDLGNGMPAQITLSECGADACRKPFQVNASWGIKIVNCDGTAFYPYDPSDTTGVGSAIEISNSIDVVITGFRVWGSKGPSVSINNTEQCIITTSVFKEYTGYAINSTNSVGIIISNNVFDGRNSSNGVYANNNTSVIIDSNTFINTNIDVHCTNNNKIVVKGNTTNKQNLDIQVSSNSVEIINDNA